MDCPPQQADWLKREVSLSIRIKCKRISVVASAREILGVLILSERSLHVSSCFLCLICLVCDCQLVNMPLFYRLPKDVFARIFDAVVAAPTPEENP